MGDGEGNLLTYGVYPHTPKLDAFAASVEMRAPDTEFTFYDGPPFPTGSPHYGNLIEPWANGEYFPLLFSREAVEERAEYRLVLMPGSGL